MSSVYLFTPIKAFVNSLYSLHPCDVLFQNNYIYFGSVLIYRLFYSLLQALHLLMLAPTSLHYAIFIHQKS